MATRRKINKKVTKSICLSERYWEILKDMAEGNRMSNGDVVRDCIIATRFLNEYLGKDKEFTVKFWEFFDEAKKTDELVIFERPEEFVATNGTVSRSTLYKESFPEHPYKEATE